MNIKPYYPLLLLIIIIISFPSICFSELKMVEGEYCDVYLGDMKNKKELEKVRKTVRKKSIENGIRKMDKSYEISFTEKCMTDIINQYLEKVVIVSHTEKGRKICDKVKITFDREVIEKYVSQGICKLPEIQWIDALIVWLYDINEVLKKNSDKINIGLIIETKINDLEENKREKLENEEENDFFSMIEKNRDKYKVVDRRHLSKILEEQKLSSSGITDSETVRLGKILNLDIIILRMIYEKSKVTKVLKVDTGEVLLFRTYQTEEGWILYGTSGNDDLCYYHSSVINVSPNKIRVWDKMKLSKVGKDKTIEIRMNNNPPVDGYDKLHNTIIFRELDCSNNTTMLIRMVDYDDKGGILKDINNMNPNIQQIQPDTMVEILFRTVCPK
ncbi:MAG: hypothetical protein NT047_17400 [Deltaproteobacteria bacterium]|nr:hypothetical protein [Deltaproteobacteria bacterium]